MPSKLQSKKFTINSQLGFLIILLAGCSGLEKSEQEKMREQNAHGEYVIRREGEVTYKEPPIKHQTREPYPWERKD